MLKILYKIGVSEPDDKTRLIRVLSKRKYEDLFSSSSLWFSSIDYLQTQCDDLEREIPSGFFKNMTEHQKEFYRTVNKAVDGVYKSFISCWSQQESKELWDTYDREHNGIAVYTTVGKLLSVLGRNNFIASSVKYIDLNDTRKHYDLAWVSVDSDGVPTSMRLKEEYKAGKYIDDHEIRFIGFDKKRECDGVRIPVELDSFIDVIKIDPFANQEISNDTRAFLDLFPSLKVKRL